MYIVDGRGSNKKALGEKNKEKVRAWFVRYSESTIKECCDGLGLTYKTVRRHIDSLSDDRS